MQQMSANWLTDMTAPSRIVEAKVEVYRDSALVYTFLPEDYLSSVKIERTTENGAMFGYTLCQKASLEVIDVDGAFVLEKDDEIRIFLGTETELAKNPIFYIEEIKRDEVKKNISIVAYDVINKSVKSLQKDLVISYPIDLQNYAAAVGSHLGVEVIWIGSNAFVNPTYPLVVTENAVEPIEELGEDEIPETPEEPAAPIIVEIYPNFSGDESLRQVLSAIAEATGTICFVNAESKICFKQLRSDSVLDITQEDYFELTTGKPETLSRATYVNELGDRYDVGEEGGYQYIIRENPFIDNRYDIYDILAGVQNSAQSAVFYPYTLKWRGNPALEIGDKVTVFQDDESSIEIYYLGETLTYNGGLLATSEWNPGEAEGIDSPPTTIGEAINRTFAKVDKVNNQIQLQAGDIQANAENIANLIINTDSIVLSVEEVNKNLEENFASVNGELQTLSEKVTTSMTKDDFSIEIENVLANGVSSVTTSTGFTFNEEGLTVSKSDSEISTKITEDGMTVTRGDETVLTANNEGVQAEDLHATTFLIIGDSARFEEFEENGETRVGCFWIGG